MKDYDASLAKVEEDGTETSIELFKSYFGLKAAEESEDEIQYDFTSSGDGWQSPTWVSILQKDLKPPITLIETLPNGSIVEKEVEKGCIVAGVDYLETLAEFIPLASLETRTFFNTSGKRECYSNDGVKSFLPEVTKLCKDCPKKNIKL